MVCARSSNARAAVEWCSLTAAKTQRDSMLRPSLSNSLCVLISSLRSDVSIRRCSSPLNQLGSGLASWTATARRLLLKPKLHYFDLLWTLSTTSRRLQEQLLRWIKITKNVTTRCDFRIRSSSKCVCDYGFASDPAGEAYTAPPDHQLD